MSSPASGQPRKITVEPEVASELNNLLQIIAGTSAVIENVWEGARDSEKYFQMLRASIERAEQVTAQLVAAAGGTSGKVMLHPDFKDVATPVASPANAATSRCILVADDEPMTLTLLQHVLSDAHFEIVLAQSGFECLDRFRRAPRSFDLVLLDLAMPFMDGQETFQRLRQISPSVPVALMAGFIERDRLNGMMSAGLAGYLGKPFAPEDVLALAHSVLERASQPNTPPRGTATAP